MPSSHALHVLDVALAIWVAAWVGLGVAIGIEVHGLTNLSHTVVVDGRAVETVGKSLEPLGSVPLVGSGIRRESRAVQQAGASAVRGGQTSGSSIRALSVLLAIAVALLPSVPVFGFYLPMRLERRRESRALREAVRKYGDDPAFRAFLARRAQEALSYARLRHVAAVPWAPPSDGDSAALAGAELDRLGVDARMLEPWERSQD
jgi:hypothetical protein